MALQFSACTWAWAKKVIGRTRFLACSGGSVAILGPSGVECKVPAAQPSDFAVNLRKQGIMWLMIVQIPAQLIELTVVTYLEQIRSLARVNVEACATALED